MSGDMPNLPWNDATGFLLNGVNHHGQFMLQSPVPSTLIGEQKTIDHRLAWLAGIIDGEGWIGIRIEPLKEVARRRGKVYHAAGWAVAVSNTDPHMLAEIMAIADVIGARCRYTKHVGHRGPQYKRQDRVTFQTKQDCRIVLEAVLPYLITKKPRAELMLRAIAHRQAKGHCRKPEWVPAGEDKPFQAMCDEMRQMNRRGPVSHNGE